jgi:hypothetical protein
VPGTASDRCTGGNWTARHSRSSPHSAQRHGQRSRREEDACARGRTGQIRELAATPRIDVVLNWMYRPTHRDPAGLAINKEWANTCVGVLDCRASLGRSHVEPGDDSSPSRTPQRQPGDMLAV